MECAHKVVFVLENGHIYSKSQKTFQSRSFIHRSIHFFQWIGAVATANCRSVGLSYLFIRSHFQVLNAAILTHTYTITQAIYGIGTTLCAHSIELQPECCVIKCICFETVSDRCQHVNQYTDKLDQLHFL